MGPFASSDGHDAPRLVDELVPRLTAVVDDVVVGGEDPVGEPVIAHELPDVLDRVQLGTFGRQSDDADISRHNELSGHVPTGLIHQQDRKRVVEGTSVSLRVDNGGTRITKKKKTINIA